jgi:hypothetical protein
MFRRVFASAPADKRRELVGTYVAFEENPSDWIAQVTCDDDGDFVILLSQGMLRLASYLAHGVAAGAPSKIDEYAALVARAQLPKQRLVPPPPGYFAADEDRARYESALREILGFLLADELERFLARELRCPNPTATTEARDAVWSDNEHDLAIGLGRTVYPDARERELAHEESALDRLRGLSPAVGTDGARALLRFLDRFQAEKSRFSPRYAEFHPAARARVTALEPRP